MKQVGFRRKCKRCKQLFVPFTRFNRVCLDCKKKTWKRIRERWRQLRNRGKL